MKKRFSYVSMIVGIVVIGIISGMVYQTISTSNNHASLKIKSFHANMIAESELDKEISKDSHTNGLTEFSVNAGGSMFIVGKDITQIDVNLKRITVNVFYEHLKKPYSIELYSNVKGW